MPHDHAKSLLEEIHTAFREVSLPPDREIAASDRHWEEVESLLNPTWKTWAEIPSDILMSNYDVLTFLSPTAFRFYLPAFMSAAIREPDGYFQLGEFARNAIPPWRQRASDLTGFCEEKLVGFSGEQLDATTRFAEYFDRQIESNL